MSSRDITTGKAGRPLGGRNWPEELAGRLERSVGMVEDRLVRPVVGITKALVYGIFALILLTMAGVVTAIAAVRLLNVYVFAGQDWASMLSVGGIFCLIGLFLWSKRTAKRGAGS